MNIVDFAATAVESGWTEAASDVDFSGHYRSASWWNPQQNQIIHVVAVRDRARPNVIESVEASTTDELGWAASRIAAWSDSAGDLDAARAHLVLYGHGRS